MKRNRFRLTALAGALFLAGFSVNVANADATYAGGAPAFGAGVVSSGSDSVGDTLLFPYYTVENDNRTLVSLVNTSNMYTVVAKLRLRDHVISNDVLDITVVLSPGDVFAGSIHESSSGGVVFTRSSDDTTCTSPLGGGSSGRTYTPARGNTGEKAKTGHIEVITMATINKDVLVGEYPAIGEGSVAEQASRLAALNEMVSLSTHTSGGDTPTGGCEKIDSYFDNSTGDGRSIGLLQDALHQAPVGSYLYGRYTVLNTATGVAIGGRPTTISGAFSNAGAGVADITTITTPATTVTSSCNVGTFAVNNSNICGQFPAHYSFPHLAHVNGVIAGAALLAGIKASNITNFNLFQDTIRADGMANEWSKNADNGVDAEFIWSLPTKYVYSDSYPALASATTIPAAKSAAMFVATGVDTISDWDGVDTALTSDSNATATTQGYFIDSGTAAGCLNFAQGLTDREEQGGPESGTSTSGGQEALADVRICNEVTAFTFGDGKGATQLATSGVVLKTDTSTLNQAFGWMTVTMSPQDNTAIGANQKGLPIIGYTMLARTFGDNKGGHYGSKTDNVKFITHQ